MSKQARHISANRQQDATQQPVTGEFFTLAGLAAAAGFSVTAGEKTYRLIRSPEPLVIQILDSKLVHDRHRIQLKLSNQTLHGMYIESAAITQPKGKEITIMLREQVPTPGEMGFPEKQDVPHCPSEFFPALIDPGEDISFGIEFALCYREQFRSKPYGVLMFDVSRLEEKDTVKRESRFRIRWS